MLICIACRIAAIMLFLIYQDKGVEHMKPNRNRSRAVPPNCKRNWQRHRKPRLMRKSL